MNHDPQDPKEDDDDDKSLPSGPDWHDFPIPPDVPVSADLWDGLRGDLPQSLQDELPLVRRDLAGCRSASVSADTRLLLLMDHASRLRDMVLEKLLRRQLQEGTGSPPAETDQNEFLQELAALRQDIAAFRKMLEENAAASPAPASSETEGRLKEIAASLAEMRRVDNFFACVFAAASHSRAWDNEYMSDFWPWWRRQLLSVPVAGWILGGLLLLNLLMCR